MVPPGNNDCQGFHEMEFEVIPPPSRLQVSSLYSWPPQTAWQLGENRRRGQFAAHWLLPKRLGIAIAQGFTKTIQKDEVRNAVGVSTVQLFYTTVVNTSMGG